jgi:hypothetical protein
MARVPFLAIAILLCWSSWAAATDQLAGQASVIDGDTLEIHGQRIRLFGIHAPESRQTCDAAAQMYRCGQQAALALAVHIAQQTVACKWRDTDRYGRIVARCRAGAEDLNGWMVAQGWALASAILDGLCRPGGSGARRGARHLTRDVHRAVGLATRRADANCHREGRAARVGSRLLQGLHNGQGVRQQLHQQDEDLLQAAGVRVRCSVRRSSL